MTAGLDDLTAESRARVEGLLAGKWSRPGDHPLARLDELALGEARVICLTGPKNNVGSRYFQLFAADRQGCLAAEPLALGLHNTGPFPAFNWVELIQYQEVLTFDDRALELWDTGLARTLFKALSGFVPSGGHMMVEYDSPTHRATERILTLRYPPATSPIGYLMFETGVRSYRDWYISEGGREGPRKLQGFRPLNEAIEAEKTSALIGEVRTMLEAPPNGAHGEWGQTARELGRKVLERLA
jgi:hypothetical protein